MTANLMIELECWDCGGSGVVPEEGNSGVATVCIECGGDGMLRIAGNPFMGRNTRDDIHTVLVRDTTYGDLHHVPYADFLAGKLPPET